MKPISRREKIFIICLVIFLHLLLLYFLAHIKDYSPINIEKNIDFSIDDENYNTVSMDQEQDEPWVSHAGNGLPIDFAQQDHAEQQSPKEIEKDESTEEAEEQLDEPVETESDETPKTAIDSAENINVAEQAALEKKDEKIVKPQKKLPTFAEIAQGFAQHVQKTMYGGSGFNTQANGYGQVTRRQLICEQYDLKVVRAIRNTFCIFRDKMPSISQRQSAAVEFALDEHGKIINLRMHTTSGNSSIDAFTLQMIRESNKSFPPLPSALGKTTYQFPLIFFNSLQDFLNPPERWIRTQRSS